MSRSERAWAKSCELVGATAWSARRLVNRKVVREHLVGKRLIRTASSLATLTWVATAVMLMLASDPAVASGESGNRSGRAPAARTARGASPTAPTRIKLSDASHSGGPVGRTRIARVEVLALGSGYAGAHGADVVRTLQRRLAGLGYAPGPVDGRYGPLTERAVSRFQATHGLAVDGVDGPLTRAALASAQLVLRRGDGYVLGGSAPVRALQRHLAAAGFSPGPIDGRYGPLTERAVVRFQATRRLQVDGIAGPQTLGRLEAAPRRRVHHRTSRPETPRGAHRNPRPPHARTPQTRTQKTRPNHSTGASLSLWLISLGCLILVMLPGLLWQVRRQRDRGTRRVPKHRAPGSVRGRDGPPRQPEDPREGIGAFKLGQQLASQGDLLGAADAFRRADERGHPAAAYELGVLLAQEGDGAGAKQAFSVARQRGHPAAAYGLGVLLEHEGDRVGAEGAFREADRRGHPGAAYNLGVLLLHRGDQSGAEDAFRRADERGHAEAAFNRGVLRMNAGDAAGAEEAFRRGDQRGDAAAAFNLGVLLERRGDPLGAKPAYQRASERGYPPAAWNLGLLLRRQSDHAGARRAFERARELGAPDVAGFAHVALRDLDVNQEAEP